MGNLKKIELKVPNLGEAEETQIIEISAKKGDSILINDPIIVLESEKAAMEVPSDYSGTLVEFKVKEGDSVSEGMVFAIMEVEDQSDQDVTNEKSTADIPIKQPLSNIQPQPTKIDFSGINAGPAVRKIARELEIELKQIKGTGKNGMIKKEDLKQFIHSMKVANTHTYASLDDLKDFGEYRIEKQSKIRAIGAQNLANSWRTIPHVTHFEEVDITLIESQRKEFNQKNNSKLTPLAYICLSVTKALKEFPIFNSSLIGEGEIMLKAYYNLGLAVDTEDGLLVPVIKNSDQHNIDSMASEIKELATKAKEKKLLQKDLSGATFSISSLGQMGGTGFTPIINPPEVGILSVSRAKNELCLIDGNIFEKKMLPIALSYDHRVINGGDAGKFLSFLKDDIEKGI